MREVIVQVSVKIRWRIYYNYLFVVYKVNERFSGKFLTVSTVLTTEYSALMCALSKKPDFLLVH